MKRGALLNLYVSAQQYAYARTLRGSTVVVVINNDKKPAGIEFEIAPDALANGAVLSDLMGVAKEVQVRDGKVKVDLPARSAAIFVRR